MEDLLPSASTCANCKSQVDGKFCSNCGQPVVVKRIDLHYLLHEIQHSIFHVDKGILYTIKELLLRPGIALRNYIAGNRSSFFKPFAFVLILGAVYGFIAHFFNLYPENEVLSMSEQGNSVKFLEYYGTTIKLVYDNYSFVMLALVPFAALASYIFFRRNGYNYWEHLVVNSYIVGMQIFVLLFFFFVYYYIRSSWVHLLSSTISYGYFIWVFIQLFGGDSKMKAGVKAAFSILFSFLFLSITLFIVVFLIFFVKMNIIN
ncbi:MAG: DUF3667 domain-containing protein [Dysgonomonas sp.]|nr:DUF3667 domain-containing protein [Dysgonomonas sp.]